MYFNWTLNSVLIIAIIKNEPTPIDTVMINVQGFILPTWFASTDKSGSAIVIIIPNINVEINSSQILFFLDKYEPIFCPIGSIERSAPSVKSAIPTISTIADMKNCIIVFEGIWTMVKEIINTINVIGKTANDDSFNFAIKLFFIVHTPFKYLVKYEKNNNILQVVVFYQYIFTRQKFNIYSFSKFIV